MDGAAPVLAARAVVKRFGAIIANDNVSFEVRPGEVHALVGENGAGKSTLMSILYGLHQPDAGEVLLDGSPVRFRSCADAMRAGIGMVFQHFLLIERFSVAENVLLGREPASNGFVLRRPAEAMVDELAARYGFGVAGRAIVEDLGVGARQQVELLKVLERDARIIILDEPSAALSPVEAEALFATVRRLRGEGRAIVLIAHKLKEVLSVADRISVMRRGKLVGTVACDACDESMLATMMVGRPIDIPTREVRTSAIGAVRLEARGLRVAGRPGVEAIRGIDLTARAGEIVGIAGVEGNGQLELAEALYGLRPVAAGTIVIDGIDVTRAPLPRRRCLGMRYVPGDRQREGLVLDFSVAENAVLGDQRRLAHGPLADLNGARQRADAIAQRYAMAGYSSNAQVRDLSGGTQQKLVVGRELAEDASIVIVFAPTRGVDVGAASQIYDHLRLIRDAGAAIVVFSYDLDEIRALADRIVVVNGGCIVGELSPDDASDDALGRLMGGVALGG